MAVSQIRSLPPQPPANFGTPVQLRFQGTTNPGTEQILINEAVPVVTQRNLWHCALRCSMEGSWELYVGSELVGSGRTGGLSPESDFFWSPAGKPSFSGDIIQLKFTGTVGFPPVPFEGYLQVADIT